MRNFGRELAQKCFSEESSWTQDDDIKRDLKMMFYEDGRFIKLKLGFLLQIAKFYN
jgi:hypothetical protein